MTLNIKTRTAHTDVLFFELMGETLRSFGTLFREKMIPEPVMRKFIIQLLVALGFAHDHNVVHTGISSKLFCFAPKADQAS